MTNKPHKRQYIKYNWVSEDPRLIDKASWLAEQYRNDKQSKRRNSRDFEAAFNALLTSIDVFDAYAGTQLWITTNKNLFEGKTRRNPTYTTEIKDAINWLIANHYLVKVEGISRPFNKHSKGRRWTPFTYELGNKWLTEISDKPLSDPLLIRRNPLCGYIEVRIKDDKGAKTAIPLTDDQKVKYKDLIESTNQTLEAYDGLMKTVKVTLGNDSVSSALTSLTRVFTRGDLEKLGRFYCPIQNYKGETRKYLRFSGDPTIEIDYSSIHPHMAYHNKGLSYPGSDPYIIEGFDRDTVKTAFNIMINRGSSRSAAQTLSHELDLDYEDAKQLEEAIIEEHNPIADLFSSDTGLELQRQDSDIAFTVLDHFITNKLPIIPIHDSFICSVRNTEDLVLSMVSAYSDIVTKDSVLTMMRGIKGSGMEYSNELNSAIELCFRQRTEGMDKLYWDALIANEPIQSPKEIEVDEVDIDDAI